MNTLKQMDRAGPARIEKPWTESHRSRPAHADCDRRSWTGLLDTPIAVRAQATLRSLARRWMALAEEIALHDQHLARITTATAGGSSHRPSARGFGSPSIGPPTPTAELAIFGDNPDRIRSEACLREALRRTPDPGLVWDDHRSAHRAGRGRHHSSTRYPLSTPSSVRVSRPTFTDTDPATTSPRTIASPRRVPSAGPNATWIRLPTNASARRELPGASVTDFRARQEIIQTAWADSDCDI